MADNLEGLDDLTDTITYRTSKKVVKRLEEVAKQDGRKPGAMARHLLEIALGFRKPVQLPSAEVSNFTPIVKKKTVNG